eukprot:GGOE01003208.1.p1 GENE.GGOE01003208.1~~GGOE01003208.1.p1  ORF type:complete len:205 (-),score=0.65 GGOE01003208.1:217-804(-)
MGAPHGSPRDLPLMGRLHTFRGNGVPMASGSTSVSGEDCGSSEARVPPRASAAPKPAAKLSSTVCNGQVANPPPLAQQTAGTDAVPPAAPSPKKPAAPNHQRPPGPLATTDKRLAGTGGGGDGRPPVVAPNGVVSMKPSTQDSTATSTVVGAPSALRNGPTDTDSSSGKPTRGSLSGIGPGAFPPATDLPMLPPT